MMLITRMNICTRPITEPRWLQREGKPICSNYTPISSVIVALLFLGFIQAIENRWKIVKNE